MNGAHRIPSRTEVEFAIVALGIKDEQEKQQIRDYWDAQRVRPPEAKTLWLVLANLILLGMLAYAVWCMR